MVRLESLVAARARLTPDRPAVVDDRGSAAPAVTTFAELDRNARKCATVLAASGITAGDYVGILAGHHSRTIAALVGVLYAGAAYIPLDPRWPLARQLAVLDQAGSTVLLADATNLARARALADASDHIAQVVALNDRSIHALEPDEVEDLWDSVATEEDLARAAGFNLRTFEAGADEIAAYIDRVVALVEVRPGLRVLEVGSGVGLIAVALAENGALVTALDPSQVALDRISDKRVRTIHGQAEDLPALLSGEEYDVVLLASVVQFLGSPDTLEKVLADAAALLSPEGRVVLADLVPPEVASGSHLGVTRSELAAVSAPHYRQLDVHTRDLRFGAALARRWDAVLHRYGAGLTGGVRFVSAATVAGVAPIEFSETDVDATAYAIFTSGTTGTPKGVMVTHRSVANLIDWVNREAPVTSDDRLLFVTSLAFDLSVYDMFGVLAAGGTVVTMDDADLVDPDLIAAALARHRITFWDSAPAVLGLVLESLTDDNEVRPDVRLVFLSGDWIPLPMVDAIRARLPRSTLIALGGATEATVWSNSYRVDQVDPDWRSVPYGKPIQNARYYVLDEDLVPVADGETGDLYIAGECLAQGYLGDAELTAAKFRNDPFVPGDRMYETGDRARWMNDGNLEFLGRRDAQAKVRGYRVELGDVRHALLNHPGVLDAAVVAAGPRESRELHGFWTGSPEPATIRAHLLEVLPPYYVPAFLTQLDEMPVSQNGKVDQGVLRDRAERSAGSSAREGQI